MPLVSLWFRLLMVLALVGGILALITPSADAAAPSLTVSRSTAIAGERVVVTLRAGQRVARPARLQFDRGSGWRAWRSGRTSAKGTVAFTVSAPSSTVRLRAVFPRAKVKGVKRSKRVSRAVRLRVVRQAVALQVVKDGDTATAVVTTTPARTGRGVSLQRREPDGSWRTIVSGRRVDARGRVTISRFASDLEATGRQYRAALWGFAGAPSAVSTAASVTWPITTAVQEPVVDSGGEPTLLTATTTGPVSSVRFYVDGREVGRDTSAPWSFQWQPVRGRHDVVARGIGPSGTVLSEVVEFDQPGAANDASTGLPAGFSIDTVQAGLELPTSFAIVEGGRVFVAEKSGRVLTFVRLPDGSNSPTEVVADLRDHVSQDGDRGMTGLAADPRFGDGSGDHDRLYVSYVLEQGRAAYEQAQQVQALDLGDWQQGDPPLAYDAEGVILGRETGGQCLSASGPFPDDCLPLVGASHTVGDLLFDHEGNLLVGVGDGASFAAGLGGRAQALRAQDPRTLAGKVLRIDPETGRGVPDNPYFGRSGWDAADPDDHGTSNASRVLAMGLRNPFRLSVRDDGVIVIGEVGEADWEELNVVPHDHHRTEAPNFGWPCYEGQERTPVPVSSGAEPDPQTNPWDQCRVLWDRGGEAVSWPAHVYSHSAGGSVTGGVFYTGQTYPQDYRGSYFFGDYAQDFLRTARMDDMGVLSDVEAFAPRGVPAGPVKFAMGPDDRIWYLSIYDGSIRVIDYAAPTSTSACPVGTFARTVHDLSDSSLANDPADYEPGWSWLRFADATLPLDRVGERTCVETIGIDLAAGQRPADELTSDRYGVRWQGRVRLDGGTYQFAASGQDWVRLWVDEELQFEWFASPFFGQQKSTVRLPAGIHTVRFETVHDSGPALASVRWDQVGSLPKIRATAPTNGIVLPTRTVDGDRHATLDYAFALEPGDTPVTSVTVVADLIHVTDDDQHAHPTHTRTFTADEIAATLAGSFDLNDGHARGNTVFRLRARADDESGASRWSAPTYVCLQGNAVGICGSS